MDKSVGKIKVYENQNSGHEYISRMIFLVKIITASRTREY